MQGLLARKTEAPPPPPGTALRVGLVTSLANPKLAVFFVALFPQFIPAGAPVLPSALGMAATVVALDLVWYSALAYGVARTRRAFVEGAWLRRAERFTGGAVGLGCGWRSSGGERQRAGREGVRRRMSSISASAGRTFTRLDPERSGHVDGSTGRPPEPYPAA